MGLVSDWGSTAAERAAALPGDDLVAEPDVVLHRAIDIDAPAAVTYRWLCQMRVAPYSYDTLDNFGRRSPQSLTPGLDELAVGQRIAKVFRVAGFERDRFIVMRTRNRVFGEVVMTYVVTGPRLLGRLTVRYPRSPVGLVMRAVLPAGDLVMMRRQLLNFKGLAEATG
jgi:hypothetical protein